MASKEIQTFLIEDAAYYDSQMNSVKLQQYSDILDNFPIEGLKKARTFFRSQPGRRQMPMPADYISAIPDGRPSAQESWAMIPRDENASVIWTNEMRMAYSIVASLIAEGNMSGAFFAYKEAYEKLVAEAKSRGEPARWSPSEGHDKSGRAAAYIEAVDKKRITMLQAVEMFPELPYIVPSHPALKAPEVVKQIGFTDPDPEGKKKVHELLQDFYNKEQK